MSRLWNTGSALGSLGPWLALLVAAGCSGWPSHLPAKIHNLHGAPVGLGAVGVLPPESPRLDPLRARAAEPAAGAFETSLEKKLKREAILARVVDEVAPVVMAASLDEEGLTAVALTRADLLRHVVSGGISIGPPEEGAGVEDRLSYSSLARTYGFTQLLRIAFDGVVREGSGGDSWLFGTLDVEYPSGTTWYEIRMTGEILDALTGEVQLRTTREGRSHSTIFSLVRFASDEEMIETLARSVAERVVDDLGEAAASPGAPVEAPVPPGSVPDALAPAEPQPIAPAPFPPAPDPAPPAAEPPVWEPYQTPR